MRLYRVWWSADHTVAFIANEPVSSDTIKKRHALPVATRLTGDARYVPCATRSYARLTGARDAHGQDAPGQDADAPILFQSFSR